MTGSKWAKGYVGFAPDLFQPLFGQENHSDCTVLFILKEECIQDGEQNPAKRQRIDGVNAPRSRIHAIGDPLPGHSFALKAGSAYFRAQAELWTEQLGPGARPQLRVTLDCAEDLPHALTAIRFIYTGTLEDVGSASGLLQVRRMAAYLQVEGCVEACDRALMELPGRPRAAQPHGSAAVGSMPASVSEAGLGLAGVVELYRHRHMLPAKDDDPTAAALMEGLYDACRQQLVRYCGTLRSAPPAAAAGEPPGADANLGELLGWAFRDAPYVLNNPSVRLLMHALPAAAMEALLGSDIFATDSEASVLLLLADWLDAHQVVTGSARDRLCKLIRLRQLDLDYLICVVPELSWFPISRREHNFLCRCAAADAETYEALTEAAGPAYDLSSPWYSGTARPCARADAGKKYEWYIPRAELVVALSEPGPVLSWAGRFGSGQKRLVANGFYWQPEIEYGRGDDSAGLYVCCRLPGALRIRDPGGVKGLGRPGPLTLAVYEANLESGEEDCVELDWGNDACDIGGGRGCEDAMPLLPREPGSGAAPGAVAASAGAVGAADPDPLSRWDPYIKDGKIRGYLVWAPMSDDTEEPTAGRAGEEATPVEDAGAADAAEGGVESVGADAGAAP